MKSGASVLLLQNRYMVLVPCPLYNYDSHTYISSIDLQTVCPDAYMQIINRHLSVPSPETNSCFPSIPPNLSYRTKQQLHSSCCCLSQKYWNNSWLLFFLAPHPVQQLVLSSLTSESDHVSTFPSSVIPSPVLLQQSANWYLYCCPFPLQFSSKKQPG